MVEGLQFVRSVLRPASVEPFHNSQGQGQEVQGKIVVSTQRHNCFPFWKVAIFIRTHALRPQSPQGQNLKTSFHFESNPIGACFRTPMLPQSRDPLCLTPASGAGLLGGGRRRSPAVCLYDCALQDERRDPPKQRGSGGRCHVSAE